MEYFGNYNSVDVRLKKKEVYRKQAVRVVLFILVALLCMAFAGGCRESRQKIGAPKIKSITPENVHGVIAPDDNHIWVTGNYGVIQHSSDGGATWSAQESGVSESILIDGVFLDLKTGWVVGINGTILYTRDGGSTWAKQNTGTERHLFGISFVDQNHGWAVGEWGTILHTRNGGQSWKPQSEETDSIYNSVCFVDTQTGWIVGERGTILHTADGGMTWNTQMPKSFERVDFEDELMNPRPTLFSVMFIDRNNGWFCGIDATIGKTTDGGATWELLPVNTRFALYTIFIKESKAYAVGDKGAYVVSEDGGESWQCQKDAITTRQPLRDVWFSSPERGWIVGANGTVVHTTDSGKSWKFLSGISYDMEFFKMPKALEFGGGVE